MAIEANSQTGRGLAMHRMAAATDEDKRRRHDAPPRGLTGMVRRESASGFITAFTLAAGRLHILALFVEPGQEFAEA